ncbi:MAG: efflux RND transporter periplasmic adaptor subunit [Christensenellales bacterium]
MEANKLNFPLQPDAGQIQDQSKKNQRRKLAKYIIVAAILCGIGVYLALPQPPKEVMMETVQKGTITKTIEVNGIVSAHAQQVFYAPYSGVVGEVFVTEGQKIKAKEPLFSMVDTDLRDQISRAEQELSALEKSLPDDAFKKEAISAAQLGSMDYNSFLNAIQEQGDAVNAQNEGLRDELESRIAQLQQQIGEGVVTAPAPADVIGIFVQAGDQVLEKTGCVALSSGDQVMIEAAVTERELRYIEEGQRAAITIDAQAGRSWAGEVTHISDIIKREDVSAYCEIEVTPDSMQAMLGATAKLAIEYNRAEDVLYLPVQCIAQDEEGQYVLVLQKGVAQRKKVTTGMADGYSIEIKSGLALGDEVLENPNGISEGDRVHAHGGDDQST